MERIQSHQNNNIKLIKRNIMEIIKTMEGKQERPLSKYEQALSKYALNISDEEVRNAVRKLIAEKVHENDTPEVKTFLMGSVELTTLKTTDSEESVLAFTERVNQFDEAYPQLPHVATICVYPCFAKTGGGRCGSGLCIRQFPLVPSLD